MRAVCASVSSGVRVFQCASVCVCAGVGCLPAIVQVLWTPRRCR